MINPLQIKNPTEQKIDHRTQHLVHVFKELLPNATLSHNMEALLYPCISTLLRLGNTSLVDLQAFMDDKRNKKWVKLGLKSPYLQERNFFQYDFQQGIYKLTKASLQSKLQTLLNRPSFYHLINGQNTLDVNTEMQKGNVMVFNLSKGQLGIETSQIFGRLLLAMIQSIAQSRSHIPKKFRKDCFVFIDECHNYISPSLDLILKEARKFGVYLVLANQNMSDIQPLRLLNNLLNNTDVKIIGANGNRSRQILSKEVGLKIDEFNGLQPYEFILQS